MTIVLFILIVIISIIVGLIILIQNPKGGGLSGTLAGFNNQFMGVKQTTDVLEKGTWVLAVLIALLTVISPIFIAPKSGTGSEPNLRPTTTQPSSATPTPTLPAPQQTPPPAQP